MILGSLDLIEGQSDDYKLPSSDEGTTIFYVALHLVHGFPSWKFRDNPCGSGSTRKG